MPHSTNVNSLLVAGGVLVCALAACSDGQSTVSEESDAAIASPTSKPTGSPVDASTTPDAAAPVEAGAATDAGARADAVAPEGGSNDGLLDDDTMGLTEVVDMNPEPDVIEIELEARIEDLELVDGLLTPAWTYNGGVPGPLIRAKVGDRLIVHFTNNLPESTSIHWHGLRIPNDMDGVPNVTQAPIEPGESFDYDFVLNDAGTFWYHPHANTVEQVGWGLYGPLIVEDPSDPDLGPERMIVLSDIDIEDDGQFRPTEFGEPLRSLFGREGNFLLVNGKLNPTFEVRSGRRERWRVLNAARSRYFSLAFADQDFVRLGGDNGLAAEPVLLEDMPIVVSGERSDLSIAPVGEPGSTVQVQWIPVERGFGSTFNRNPENLFQVRFSDEPALEPEPLPEVSRVIEPIDVTDATPVDFEFTIDTVGDENVMGINHLPMKDLPPFQGQLGETQVWTLTNHSDFSHPFHLHGYFFQVLDVDGVPSWPLEWRDTVDVATDATVRIAVTYDERPGTWMVHCHILDHAERGMMGMLEVHDPAAVPTDAGAVVEGDAEAGAP